MKPKFVIDKNSAPIPALQPVSTQAVDGTSASAQSTEFTSDGIVRIVVSADARLLWGTNPTALSTSMPISADTAEYFSVREGQKIAVLNAIATISLME